MSWNLCIWFHLIQLDLLFLHQLFTIQLAQMWGTDLVRQLDFARSHEFISPDLKLWCVCGLENWTNQCPVRKKLLAATIVVKVRWQRPVREAICLKKDGLGFEVQAESIPNSSNADASGWRPTRPTIPKHQRLTSWEWDSWINFLTTWISRPTKPLKAFLEEKDIFALLFRTSKGPDWHLTSSCPSLVWKRSQSVYNCYFPHSFNGRSWCWESISLYRDVIFQEWSVMHLRIDF